MTSTGAMSAMRDRPSDAPSSTVETTGAPVPTVPDVDDGPGRHLAGVHQPGDDARPSTTETQGFSFIHVELSSSDGGGRRREDQPAHARAG